MARLGKTTIPVFGDDYKVALPAFAWTQPASDEAVASILAMDPELEGGETRSEWQWIRLMNGDLILGVFPQDEGYFRHEQERTV